VNPLHLTARNYRSFESLDLDLPTGCVAILGENGAGKSSVVNAIDLAVFGPESRSLADALSEGCVDEELLLELTFEHAGSEYRVRRTFSPRGRGKTTLDFEWWKDTPMHSGDDTGPQWEPLTSESVKETQARIEQTIGLSRETFRASAFLAQGDGAAFTEAQPRDRKRILAEVLGLEQWTVLAECARVDRRLLETRAAALAGKTQQAEEQAALLPVLERDHADTLEAETVAADNVADLERSHAELAVQYQQAREHAAKRAAAEAELATAQGALATLQTRDQEANKAAHERAAAAAELKQLPTYPPVEEVKARVTVLEAAVEAHREAVTAHEHATRENARIDDAKTRLHARAAESDAFAIEVAAKLATVMGQPDSKCDLCGQQLHDEARTKVVLEYEDERKRHLAAATRDRSEADSLPMFLIPPAPAGEPPTVELDLARKTIEAISAAAAKRAVLEERIRQYELLLGNGPTPDQMVSAQTLTIEKRDALEAVGAALDVAALTAQGSLVAEQLKQARGSLDTHRQQRARLDERIQVAKKAAASLVEVAAERKQLDDSLVVVVALERAFSPDGVPALIVENSAIPYLETEANRILAELGTAFRIELRTQAALKSGDGLRDTLDVIVCSETGERAYETFSGGEKTRLNLALRIALARLLAHRRGAESRLLCVDEPEYLDEQGTAALVDVLRGLEGDFDKLYIVSHVPSLRDSFDTTLSVVRDEAGSRVVEAGVFETVAA